MKTNHPFVVFFFFLTLTSFGQESTRIEVTGKIIVERNDLEGVTVYNASSNKGTVTDADGNFVIEVALNDHVYFGALQFKDFQVVVNNEIMTSKKMTVYLVEQVNKLDEVVILPHELSGNLAVDTESIELVNPNLDALYFGLDNLDKMEFFDDRAFDDKVVEHALSSVMNKGQLYNGVDFKKIFGGVIKSIFGEKERKIYTPTYKKKTILDVYSKDYLSKALEINKGIIVEFLFFVEENNFDYALLEPHRELEFLEFLKTQEQLFLKQKNGQD